MQPKRILFSVCLLSLLIMSVTASAREFIANGPIVARTQNPIYLLSIGQQPDRATVLKKWAFDTSLGMSYSNIFNVEQNLTNNNEVFLDMELARIALRFKAGIGHNTELGLELPFLHFNGGYFDSWIQSFHKAFGFPNGGRGNFPNGMFRYRVTQNGRVIYNVRRQPIGLSDLIVGVKQNLVTEGKLMPAMAWRFRFKFPTGSQQKGMGSGGSDFALSFLAEKSFKRWHFYTNIDYMVVSGVDWFEDLYNRVVLAWLLALEFSVSTPVSLIAQIQSSSPLNSGLGMPKWNGIPMDLVIGAKGTHRKLLWGNDFYWQCSFTEDLITTGPSVDLGITLLVGMRFGNRS